MEREKWRGSANPSDARLKKNIQPLTGAIDQLLQLRGVTYEWKELDNHGKTAGTKRGFIAQEMERVFPDWVQTDDKDSRVSTFARSSRWRSRASVS
jgi:Chaperone of endosialidase